MLLHLVWHKSRIFQSDSINSIALLQERFNENLFDHYCDDVHTIMC